MIASLCRLRETVAHHCASIQVTRFIVLPEFAEGRGARLSVPVGLLRGMAHAEGSGAAVAQRRATARTAQNARPCGAGQTISIGKQEENHTVHSAGLSSPQLRDIVAGPGNHLPESVQDKIGPLLSDIPAHHRTNSATSAGLTSAGTVPGKQKLTTSITVVSTGS